MPSILGIKSFSFLHFNSQKIHQSPQRLVHRFGLCQLRLLLCPLRGLRGGTKLRRLWTWKWVNKRSNRKSPKDSVVGPLPNDLFMAYTRGNVESLKTLKLAVWLVSAFASFSTSSSAGHGKDLDLTILKYPTKAAIQFYIIGKVHHVY